MAVCSACLKNTRCAVIDVHNGMSTMRVCRPCANEAVGLIIAAERSDSDSDSDADPSFGWLDFFVLWAKHWESHTATVAGDPHYHKADCESLVRFCQAQGDKDGVDVAAVADALLGRFWRDTWVVQSRPRPVFLAKNAARYWASKGRMGVAQASSCHANDSPDSVWGPESADAK